MQAIVKRLLPGSCLNAIRAWRDSHVHQVISGNGTADHPSRAFALFGDREWSEHLVRQYLEAPATVRTSNGFHGSDARAAASRLAHRHGLVLLSAPSLAAEMQRRTVRFPRFVGMSVDVGKSADEFMARVRTQTKREINRAAAFNWDVLRDAAWCQEFHARYHREAISSRHGSEGFIMSVQHMVQAVANEGWEFVRVFKGEQCVAAMLGQPDPGGYYLRRVGWLDGDPALLQEGVLAACYWYSFARARELGLSKVRLGGTPPYLEDGLFQYKMKWRSYLDAADTTFGIAHLMLNPSHPDVVSFLKRRSLLTLDEANRFVVYSAKYPSAIRLTDELTDGLHAWKRLDVASGIFVDEPLTPKAKTPRPAPAR